MKKKPNVLFVVTDDQRWDTIHALGNKEIITPNLDKLVSRGTAFVEYTFLMIINGVIGTALYILMLGETPEITTYLIFSVYSFICIVFAFFQAKKLYDSQQTEVKK